MQEITRRLVREAVAAVEGHAADERNDDFKDKKHARAEPVKLMLAQILLLRTQTLLTWSFICAESADNRVVNRCPQSLTLYPPTLKAPSRFQSLKTLHMKPFPES